MLSRWKSEWLSECNSRIRAHNELCRFRSDIPRFFFLFRNIDGSEWPQMLLGISTWSNEKFSICHLLWPQVVWRRRLEGEFFFHNKFKRLWGVRIKGSCLLIYRELVSKQFSSQFSRKCITLSKRDRVFSLPCGDLKTLSRVISPLGSE